MKYDDDFIDEIIQKLKDAKDSEDDDFRDTRCTEAMVHLEMKVKEKRFSELFKESIEKSKPSVTIEELEERAEHLEDYIERLDKRVERNDRDASQPYFGIYGDEGLKMFKYEISRMRYRKEDEEDGFEPPESGVRHRPGSCPGADECEYGGCY